MINMNELEKVIEQVGKDKGIDRSFIISALEEAMLMVARRKYGANREIEAKFNEDIGEVELFEFKMVVEKVHDKAREISIDEARTLDSEVSLGDSIGIKLDSTLLTRIAAQTAKQVIVQKVRDAERELIYNEFQHRKGEIITGLIRRVDRGNVIVDLGRTEGFMPLREQIPGEAYNPGDRLQAYLMDVQLTPKGPRIILSRACPEYLMSLFYNEVPEIREGLVIIRGAARDPGIRAKIAVISRDSDVDPIGACVGVRGSRVQNIVQELRGERIDIVPWDDDISRFVCNALAPAEIQKVIIDDDNKAIEVVVGDANLSLAIGRKGQNVRLASQLTGWRLDIVSEALMAKRLASAKFQFALIPGVTDTLAMALYQNGFETVRDVAESEAAMFASVPGFDEAKGAELIAKARDLVASGKLDELIPKEEEILAAAAAAKPAGDGNSMESIEARLRAEVAAREKSK
ncbi:MAG: transcription termination factor NusA [Bdellovibrionales bacterium]|nr:transcription termination factor NusA [Bdellovibrionales bacterium]